MFKYVNERLSLKILISMSTIIIIVFGGTQWYSSYQTRQTMLKVVAGHNLHMADVIKSSLTMVMKSNNYEHMPDMLEAAVRSKSVDFIDIVNNQGVVRYSSHKSKVGNPLAGEFVLRQWDLAQISNAPIEKAYGDEVLVSIPLLADESCLGCHHRPGEFLGAIMLSRNMDDELALIETIRIETLIGFVLALAITVIALHLLISGLVLTPLYRVLKGAKKLAQGDLTSDICRQVRGRGTPDRHGDKHAEKLSARRRQRIAGNLPLDRREHKRAGLLKPRAA